MKKFALSFLGLAFIAMPLSASIALAATPDSIGNTLQAIHTKVAAVNDRILDVRAKLVSRNVDVSKIDAEEIIVIQKREQAATDIASFIALLKQDLSTYPANAAERTALHNAAETAKTSLKAFLAEMHTLFDVTKSVAQAAGYIK